MKAQEPLVKRIWNIYFWGRYAECDGALPPLAMWAMRAEMVSAQCHAAAVIQSVRS